MGLWRDPRRLRELEATLDAIDEAIMTVDREYCVVGFNRAAEQLTGYSRREALGGRCFEVCAGRFCQHSCDIQAMFTTGETPPDFETVVQGKDGGLRVVRVRTVPFRDDRGEILAAVRILKDVTGTVPVTPADPAAEAALIGASPAMERVRQAVDALQDSEAPVLIWGPPGTEKERLARAIHSRSLRAGGPFIPRPPRARKPWPVPRWSGPSSWPGRGASSSPTSRNSPSHSRRRFSRPATGEPPTLPILRPTRTCRPGSWRGPMPPERDTRPR